jgi:hypothetical protein
MSTPTERFKRMLFADQTLGELVAIMAPREGLLHDARELLVGGDAGGAEAALVAMMLATPEEMTPWHRILLAASQFAQGNREPGIRTLRALTETAAESRVRLGGWRALRDLGVVADAADQVLGVVADMNVEGGVDTLAAYADGSARHLLHTGQKFIWDRPDDRLAGAIAAVIAAAEAGPPGEALSGEPAPGNIRHTLLTPGGPRGFEEPMREAGALFAAETALLAQIFALAKQ